MNLLFFDNWFVNLQAIKKIEEENARLKGHQNPQQKVQHLLAIKRENHALKEVSWFSFCFCFSHFISSPNVKHSLKFHFGKILENNCCRWETLLSGFGLNSYTSEF